MMPLFHVVSQPQETEDSDWVMPLFHVVPQPHLHLCLLSLASLYPIASFACTFALSIFEVGSYDASLAGLQMLCSSGWPANAM